MLLTELPDARTVSLAPIDGAALASALAGRVEGTYTADGLLADVTLTIGTAEAPSSGSTTTELLRRASTALTAAEHRNRRSLCFTDDLESDRGEDLELLVQLRAGIAAGQLRVHYQPQMDASGTRVIGTEALVRWQHPVRGLLGPYAFIDRAENSPIIVDLTWEVLDQAVAQAARWRAKGHRWAMSVNLSARLLVHKELLERMSTTLTRHQLPADALTLEVTESAIMSQPRHAATMLHALRALGVRTLLDDFGTGYTSLAMLSDLPLDELKLDRRFVASAPSRRQDRAVVVAVASLAQHLGLHTVAEGVEDQETADLLADPGYDSLQGFYYARPTPAEDVAAAALPAAPARADVDHSEDGGVSSGPVV